MTAPADTGARPLPPSQPGSVRVLTLSTTAFTLMFAVWLMFGVLGIPIRDELGLSDVQLSWLVAVAILNGSIWRLLAGMVTDRFGGRFVFTLMLLLTAIPAYLISQAGSYVELLIYAFLVGFAGNSFSVGIAWTAAWTRRERQGFALGVFGAGNVGASVTKFIAPGLIAVVPAAGYFGGLVPGGWRFIPFLYAVLLVLMAVAVWIWSPKPDRRPGQDRPMVDMLRPLREMRVWRFGLYYVVVFGAYVALAAWLPKYYVDVFGLGLAEAALLTALFIFPASLLRPLGGWMSDRWGARRVMYWTFGSLGAASLLLSMPYGHIVLYVPEQYEPTGTREVLPYELGVVPFTVAVFVIGIAMGVGKAAVYKHIPEYFPKDVGAVGGLVGLIGALGGFFLPPMFAYAQNLTGLPQTTFFIIFLLTAVSAVWMHLTIHRMMTAATPQLADTIEIPHGHSPTRPDSITGTDYTNPSRQE
jgi:MFS transporter, NNP family, nitrate/nitrite transporter